jgi:hypothetical protein
VQERKRYIACETISIDCSFGGTKALLEIAGGNGVREEEVGGLGSR